ncbi:hypothetical protein IMAU10217_03220 [Lactiplantibacillus plantarum]|nr:hypothetical protein [Lactiplantibacillus plantarum]
MFYFDYGYHYISYQIFSQFFLCTVHRTRYTVSCTLYTVYWVLCTVHLNNFIKKAVIPHSMVKDFFLYIVY